MEKVICIKSCIISTEDGEIICLKNEVFHSKFFGMLYISLYTIDMLEYFGLANSSNFEELKKWKIKNRDEQIDLILG